MVPVVIMMVVVACLRIELAGSDGGLGCCGSVVAELAGVVAMVVTGCNDNYSCCCGVSGGGCGANVFTLQEAAEAPEARDLGLARAVWETSARCTVLQRHKDALCHES